MPGVAVINYVRWSIKKIVLIKKMWVPIQKYNETKEFVQPVIMFKSMLKNIETVLSMCESEKLAVQIEQIEAN